MAIQLANKFSDTPVATPTPSKGDAADFKAINNLEPYGGVTVRSPRTERDEAEPPAPASFPLSVRGSLVDRLNGNVADTLRRRGGEHGPQDEVTARPKVADLPDAHFTPGTLQREHDNDGYTKTHTRPTGRGGGGRTGDSGARQAGLGTRGAAKRGGPFSDSND